MLVRLVKTPRTACSSLSLEAFDGGPSSVGHSQGCGASSFSHVCFEVPEDVSFEKQLDNQLVPQLMRKSRATFFIASLSRGRLVAHDVFFKFVTVPVSASYSRVRLTTVSNCSTLCGPDTNIRRSSITVARIASGFEARTNFAHTVAIAIAATRVSEHP